LGVADEIAQAREDSCWRSRRKQMLIHGPGKVSVFPPTARVIFDVPGLVRAVHLEDGGRSLCLQYRKEGECHHVSSST